MNVAWAFIVVCTSAGLWLFWHDRHTHYIGRGIVLLFDKARPPRKGNDL